MSVQPHKPRYDVKSLKRDHSIVDVLERSGVQLLSSGQHTRKACCPFHDDHTPSLLVDDRDGHYHCFACGAHGDVIDFVMATQGVSFTEACERISGLPLGARELPEGREQRSSSRAASSRVCHHSHQHTGEQRQWDRLSLEEQVVMNTACALYQERLWNGPNAIAYLRERGIADWVSRECALGYADGHSLETYLRRHHGLRTAQELGLLRKAKRDNGAPARTEFFAGRIVVPEIRSGQAIWFIGRTLDEKPERPKFLALAGERPILGFERVAGQSEVFLCEGVWDYLTAVSWKLPAFSPCGTNFPDERLGFLARARVVWGALDGDDAGRAAAERFGGKLGGRFRPLQLPEGMDLNDLGRHPEGHSRFLALIADARRRYGLEGT